MPQPDPKQTRSIEQGFSRGAQEYAANSAPQAHIAADLISHIPAELVPRKILEIGCGTGTLTTLISKRFPQAAITACDISNAMLAHMPPIPNVRTLCLNAEDQTALPPSDHYDLIISNMTVQWLTDIRAAYTMWQSRLTPGSVLLTSRPARTAFQEWRTSLSSLGLPDGTIPYQPTGVEHITRAYPVRYPSTLVFLKTLKKTGASTARGDYIPLPPAQIKQACAQCDSHYKATISWDYTIDKIEP